MNYVYLRLCGLYQLSWLMCNAVVGKEEAALRVPWTDHTAFDAIPTLWLLQVTLGSRYESIGTCTVTQETTGAAHLDFAFSACCAPFTAPWGTPAHLCRFPDLGLNIFLVPKNVVLYRVQIALVSFRSAVQIGHGQGFGPQRHTHIVK